MLLESYRFLLAKVEIPAVFMEANNSALKVHKASNEKNGRSMHLTEGKKVTPYDRYAFGICVGQVIRYLITVVE